MLALVCDQRELACVYVRLVHVYTYIGVYVWLVHVYACLILVVKCITESGAAIILSKML